MEKAHDEINKDQLINDFKVVVADAEVLLKATANTGGEKLAEVRAKAEDAQYSKSCAWRCASRNAGQN